MCKANISETGHKHVSNENILQTIIDVNANEARISKSKFQMLLKVSKVLSASIKCLFPVYFAIRLISLLNITYCLN